MELILKNVNPKDFMLLKELSERLGIQVETKTELVFDKPDNLTVFEDMKEAVAEIKLARASKKQLQSARDFLNEL